jgi:ERF superfamily
MSWTRRPPVHRSSESFAALAAALAKAQAHLVNPEKSLTATIAGARPGDVARSFRYAPLSSGLEIVRKTLSEHELAVIQTTAVDQASRILTLTTLLAHSSGEWIASYWPVCSVAEIANPQRMGAALTYARRYGLFTLVGIAGEDDLDAPDICMPAPQPGPAPGSSIAGLRLPYGKARGAARNLMPAVLAVDESTALRDRLLSEIAGLASPESATSWARAALAAKNTLTTADAKLLEDAFEQKVTGLSAAEVATPVVYGGTALAPGSQEARPSDSADNADPYPHQPAGIDKSVLAISVPRRYRNKEHLRYVTSQPCLFCARKPSDAHHLRFMQPRALGRKVSDEFAVPLCRTHHRAAHQAKDEQAWWSSIGIDPVEIARKLWRGSRAAKGQEQSDASLQDARTRLQDAQIKVAPSTQGPGGKAP